MLSTWKAVPPGPPFLLAWLSLDRADNDPVRFWSYVIATLRRVDPKIGESSLASLRSPRLPPRHDFLTSLLNELTSLPTDTVLVFDDYHSIDSPEIHQGLTFLVDHLPPRFHLVLATRADPPWPLARLRARGALLEIRARDLRLSPAETEMYVAGVIGLSLGDEALAALGARTEGWIAGLQLAGLAMRNHENPERFVEEFTGSHRFVADYLVEEVVQRQTKATRAFLLQTSVLERMCAPLCEALLADDPAVSSDAEHLDAQTRLEQLDRDNLFLVPLDGERRWYRYHHLFADLLRARLKQECPELVRVLHRRASEWLERADLRAEAIQHALKAEDLDRAADLLEPIADELWMGGQMATLLGWLGQLSADVLRAHPRLLIAQAAALGILEGHRVGTIEASLFEAEAALGAGDSARGGQAGLTPAELDRLTGKILAIRAGWASSQSDTRRTIVLALEALGRLGPDDLPWRISALTALAMGHSLRGEVVAAARVLSDVTRLSLAPAASSVGPGAILWLASAHVAQGKLREASALYRQGLDQVIRQGAERVPVAANFYIGLGIGLDYEWNDLETAERHLEEGIRLAGPTQWPWVLIDACATLAKVRRTRGEESAVRELLQRMEQHARSVEMPWAWMPARLAASMARAYLAFGQVERAADWATRFDLTFADDLPTIVEFERVTIARLLIAQGKCAPALAELDQLAPPAEAQERWGALIEMQVLRAVALERMGRREEALGALGRALARAVPEGYVRRFVDEGPTMQSLLADALRRGIASEYVARLPAAFGDAGGGWAAHDSAPARLEPSADAASPRLPSLPPPPSLIEPLSERERDVLRLLVAGRSGPQIADALVVAPSTVKTHLKSIYGKMDVHSRDQAITRARELRLL